jgi:quinol monooxygenase YgiN
MTKFYCVDQIYGLEGKEKELLAAFAKIRDEIIKCPGCEAYEVYKNGVVSSHYILYERWTTREQFEDHTRIEALGVLAKERNKYLAKPIDFDLFYEQVV